MPKVSIVLTSYNHEKFIAEAIDSVLAQTFTDFELIIADDCSTDRSWEIIQSYSDPRIRAIRSPINRRTAFVFEAIHSACGEYLAIHHSDDVWMPQKLERQVQFIEEHPGYAAIFTHVQPIDGEGNALESDLIFNQPNKTRFEWLRCLFDFNMFCHPTVLMRSSYARELYTSYGPTLVNDYSIWISTCIYNEVFVIQEKLVNFRLRPESDSGENITSKTHFEIESHTLLTNFLKIQNLDEWIKIFPQVEKYVVNGQCVPEYAFAQICLKREDRPAYVLFGLHLLIKLLSSPPTREILERLYKFTTVRMSRLAKRYDIFSLTSRQTHHLAALYISRSPNIEQLNSVPPLTLEYDTISNFPFEIQFTRPLELVDVKCSPDSLYALFCPTHRIGVRYMIYSVIAKTDTDEYYCQFENISPCNRDKDSGYNIFIDKFPVYKISALPSQTCIITINAILKPLTYTDLQSFCEQHDNLLETHHKLQNKLLQCETIVHNLTERISEMQSTLLCRAALQQIKICKYIHKNGIAATLKKTFFYLVKKFFSHDVPPAIISDIAYEDASSLTSCSDIKLIAFYLPQFHTFLENDAWWGKGFTEWTNVRRSEPMYKGHKQPEIPHQSLGYYDLSDPEVMRRQAEMAKRHGVYGFCFHHYWFSGKRLMEKPVDQLLADPTIEIPFCLNWANENWTRRWDGQENDVLIAQKHSEEDDKAFMKDALRYFKDKRYLRIDGRPLFLVYRADILPDMRATLEIWRNVCRANSEVEPFFVMVQSFTNNNPQKYGFDAAVQFPPFGEYSKVKVPGLRKGFQGNTYSYDDLKHSMLANLTTNYTHFPCVSPAWDNTPRRLLNASIFVGSTPQKYENWLRQACAFVRSQPLTEQRLVFVNAWNEWAEGAHLEPSQASGFAYLNATSRGIGQHSQPTQPSVTSEKKN